MISPVRSIDILVLASLSIAHISRFLILLNLNVLCF